MQSELIAIPRDAWNADGGPAALATIAGIALAIERRRSKRVPLPRESERYTVVCDRLSDLARESEERGAANRVWVGDDVATLTWAMFTHNLLRRVDRPARPALQAGLARVRATFVPPQKVSDVVAALEWLFEDVVRTWPDADEFLPIIGARLVGFRVAQEQGAATVEVLTD